MGLSFARRWLIHTPEWLGNAEQPVPFRVKFARLTTEDLRQAGDRWKEMLERPPTVDELEAFFADKVQGPSGRVEIDGTVIEPWNLRGLLEFAAREPMHTQDSLAMELWVWLQVRNHWSEDALGNSERRRSGSGGTAPPTTGEPHHPTAAADAAVSSTTAPTSSGHVSTTGVPEP